MKISLLSAALAACIALPAGAEPTADAQRTPVLLKRQSVDAEAPADPRFEGMATELESGKILAGKKSTSVALAEQPDIVNSELRQAFVRLPGLLLSEQQIPGHFNVNYRGLGDPHESEFVSFFENGIPLSSDAFGYPTLYQLTAIDRVERIDFVRGGSALLYGPQPGPSINFITRAPQTDQELQLRSRHVGGKNGLYATFNEVSGGSGNFGWQVGYEHRQFDGERRNADSDVNTAYATLIWQPDEDSSWRFDYTDYDSESGEAGRLTSNVYASQPDWTSTPFNRLWIEREMAVLSHTRRLNAQTTLDAKLWHSSLDRYSVRTRNFFPNTLATNIVFTQDRQQFSNTGLDVRLAHDWGSNHTLTFGMTHYVDDSPRSRLNIPDDDVVPRTGFRQERDTLYTAVFAESIFRLGQLSLIPSARFEWLEYDINEPQVQAGLGRAPIDRSFSQNVPLFGIAATYDVADQSLQWYGNISQAYRPMRFDDVANPLARLSLNNDPDVAHSMQYELGLRGTPAMGWFFDVSVFRIDFDDKIETRTDGVDFLRVNSGDARHQGIELATDYDFLAQLDGAHHLSWFASVSFLDAEITRSENAALVGNTPAYAPDHVIKSGLIYRHGDNLKAALTATLVDDHFWQDSNRDGGNATNPIAGVVPAYEVFDLTAEWSINGHIKLLGGVNNLLDKSYYSRVRSDGLEPAAGRTPYLGVELGF